MRFVWLRNELGKVTCELWPQDGLHCEAGRRTVLAEHVIERSESLAALAALHPPPSHVAEIIVPETLTAPAAIHQLGYSA
jgi:hypothetical protein